MPNPYHDERGRFTSKGGYSTANVAVAQRTSGSKPPRSQQVRARGAVRRTAYNETVTHGGVTIDLAGHQPHEGYAYAPSKTTERVIPKSAFTPEHIDRYVDDHAALLNRKGNHLGIWEENGNIYLDVSRVGKPSATTIAHAQAAHQLGVFDLKTFSTIDIGKVDSRGKYRPLDEATHLHDQYRGQVSRAGQG